MFGSWAPWPGGLHWPGRKWANMDKKPDNSSTQFGRISNPDSVKNQYYPSVSSKFQNIPAINIPNPHYVLTNFSLLHLISILQEICLLKTMEAVSLSSDLVGAFKDLSVGSNPSFSFFSGDLIQNLRSLRLPMNGCLLGIGRTPTRGGMGVPTSIMKPMHKQMIGCLCYATDVFLFFFVIKVGFHY